MTTTLAAPIGTSISSRPRRPVATRRAMLTIIRRRFALSASTPRELLVPLLTPILFALVIAPALAKMVGHVAGGLNYSTFVAVGTIGLLVPLSCTFAGIGVIVDRESGARRELLAAPVRRSLHVLGNLAVALTISSLQLVALIGAALARGSRFHTDAAGVLWFAAAVVLFATSATPSPRRWPTAWRPRKSSWPRLLPSQSCRGSSPGRCSRCTSFRPGWPQPPRCCR
jgi:hypothetical protein